MDDGKAGFIDSKVDLRCRFINSSPPVKISQVFPHGVCRRAVTCHTQKEKKPKTNHTHHKSCRRFFVKVTWQKLVNGSKQNVAIANPSLGVSVAPPYRDRVTFKNGAVRRRTPNLEDTTISFSSLRLSDEATYICEYTTFPAGNRENAVNLTVYGRVEKHPLNKYCGAAIQAFVSQTTTLDILP